MLSGAAIVWTGAQETEKKETTTPAGDLQETLKEWVLTRQLISREKAAWQEQKKTWTDLNEIRRLEKESLNEFIESARSRVPKITEEKAALASEEKALRDWRKESLRKIDEWEKKLLPLLPLFPAPLEDSLKEPITRLKAASIAEDEEPRPLQDRTRDVVLILQGFREFQSAVTTERELLAVGGSEPRELDVLYLGLSRAWFVDAAGTFSGYGRPTPGGWVWTEDSGIASRVRKAIEMADNRVPPEFLSLPFPSHKEAQP